MKRLRYSIFFAACLFINRTEAEPMAATPEDVLQKVISILETEDSFRAIEYIERLGESSQPLDTANRYSQLVRDLHAKHRDVPRMIQIGQAGIVYCLREARRLEAENAPWAEQLRGEAKTIAYNLSVNAWPGWSDEGIDVTHFDSLAALDAARLNLRLARELNRNAEILGNAHWLIGAQHLALEQTAPAVEQFALAEDQFKAADKPDYQQMARGYRGIARLTAEATRDQGRAELGAAVKSLLDIGTDDARFFVRQLNDAVKVFTK